MEFNRVSTIDELRAMASGELVELPPFVKGQKFIARLKRPSMLKMVEKGSIPNSLLHAANSLFAGGVNKDLADNDDFLKDMLAVIDVMAESVFVEPTWRAIKAAGIELTDEQYMFIFNYAQEGVKAVEPSVEKPANTTNYEYGEGIQNNAI